MQKRSATHLKLQSRRRFWISFDLWTLWNRGGSPRGGIRNSSGPRKPNFAIVGDPFAIPSKSLSIPARKNSLQYQRRTTCKTTEGTSKRRALKLLQIYLFCPETITELLRFRFLRYKNYITAPDINSRRGPHSPEITVRISLKSPVRITAPKNNSKTISVM